MGGRLTPPPPRPPEDDAALIARIARGDRDAISDLYDRYGGVLMAVGHRILGDRRETEDLLHDVFLEAWRCASDYDPARGSVRVWLCMRMRSRALDRVRSVGRSSIVPIEEAHLRETDRAVSEDPAMAADRLAVRRALAALPAEQRAVLELGYFEGLSSSEIADRVNIPLGTVKSRVAAALSKLRVLLGAEEGTPP